VKDGCDLVAGSWSWSFVCALTRAPTLKRQLKETTKMMMTMMWILMEVEIVMVMVKIKTMPQRFKWITVLCLCN